jgi:hypothetical protein
MFAVFIGIEGDTARIIGSIVNFLFAPDEPQGRVQ